MHVLEWLGLQVTHCMSLLERTPLAWANRYVEDTSIYISEKKMKEAIDDYMGATIGTTSRRT